MSKYDMSGVSSNNDYKKAEKQPDYTGKCTIDGKELRMAGWKRTGTNGEFVSWKFSEPQEAQLQPQTVPSNDDTQDDLPF
jgi:uncharacterized protein (DUF736 family)|tara:strand:+ start:99 stop:338 length:240 start_codon:yes stop_codon:yes gene_type:complete